MIYEMLSNIMLRHFVVHIFRAILLQNLLFLKMVCRTKNLFSSDLEIVTF